MFDFYKRNLTKIIVNVFIFMCFVSNAEAKTKYQVNDLANFRTVEDVQLNNRGEVACVLVESDDSEIICFDSEGYRKKVEIPENFKSKEILLYHLKDNGALCGEFKSSKKWIPFLIDPDVGFINLIDEAEKSEVITSFVRNELNHSRAFKISIKFEKKYPVQIFYRQEVRSGFSVMNESNQVIGILKIKLDYSLDNSVKVPFLFSPQDGFTILMTEDEKGGWELGFKPISINNEGVVFGRHYDCYANLKQYALIDPRKNKFSRIFDWYGRRYDKNLICFNNNSTVMGNIYHWDFEAKHDIVRPFHYDSANGMVFPEIGYLGATVKAANDLNCMIGETKVLVERDSSDDDFPWETSIGEDEEDEGGRYRVKWMGYFRDEKGVVEIIENGTPVLINNNNKVLCVNEIHHWVNEIFLWDRKRGEKSINKLLASSCSHWKIEDVISINDRDEILAVGWNLQIEEYRIVLLVPCKE